MDDLNLTGTTLQNRYFLRERIGRGATSEVYLAWDKIRAIDLALKILHQDLAVKTRFINMFKKEASFMQDLQHKNIVRLYDFGREKRGGDVFIYISMDYINGPDLRSLLHKRGQPLNLPEAYQVASAICKALNFAHKTKVFHGDIKSANVLISQEEGERIREKDVFLADFGASRLATERQGGGTPYYMAPELFKDGAVVTEKTDIYALGVTLYEMLSGGHLPFKGKSDATGNTSREQIAWEKEHNRPVPLHEINPSLPPQVVSAVEKAMNKNPDQRYEGALDLLRDLEPAQDKNILFPEKKNQPESVQSPSYEEPETLPSISLKAHLIGIAGEKKGKKISIPTQGLTIGRSKSNEMCLADTTVSRYHAMISFSKNNFYIQDKNSSLGTYINGDQINRKTLLQDGDEIRFGRSQDFEFCVK